MRRAERLFRLVQALRARPPARPVVRAEDLAAGLEVSTRTIYRDIAHLQGSGLPIDGAAGLGYMLRPGFDLPQLTFTHAQIDALAVALALVEGQCDPALAGAAREIRDKIQAALPDPGDDRLRAAPYFALCRSSAGQDHAPALRTAIRKRRIVRLDYGDGAGALTTRRVQPLALWSFQDGWMVSGWCTLRAGFRTFRLDRIRALDLTDDPHDPDPARGLQAFLSGQTCAHASRRVASTPTPPRTPGPTPGP